MVFLVATGDEGAPESLESFRTHTPPDVELVAVPVSSDRAALATSVAPADVVLVDLPCVVGAGWLEGLRAAAYSDAGVASAVPLATSEVAGSEELGFERAAAAVRAAAVGLRPRIEEPTGRCRYIRRGALELAGELGPEFGRRCLEAGLAHVIADDVLVDGGRDVGRAPTAARAIGVARRAVGRLSVLVDARILDGPMDGTRVHVLELVAALGRAERARVTAVAPRRMDEPTRSALEQAPGVALVTLSPGEPPPTLGADIVHRPFQVSAHADLTVLGQLADRLVITHQDLISYHNPAYFPSADAWAGYRAMTARALGAADHVVFFSAHVRDEALAEELVEPHRASVVALGVDHVVSGETAARAPAASVAPGGAEALAADRDAEMILCLGTDFRHKNRVFALRLVQQLQRRHQWRGRLVCAGPHMTWGSSRQQEHALLATDDRLAAAVIELDAVSEAEKRWLLERASLVLYPTVHEGFGLIPFEAAAHGRPCLWAAGSALTELLPDAAAGIVAWDAGASADQALALIRDPKLAHANVDTIAAAAGRLHWDQTATRLIDLYHAVCDAPPSSGARLERGEGLMAAGLSDEAIRLVGPDGALPRDLERPLLALATHRRLGAPVLGAIRAVYRASLRWPRRRGA